MASRSASGIGSVIASELLSVTPDHRAARVSIVWIQRTSSPHREAASEYRPRTGTTHHRGQSGVPRRGGRHPTRHIGGPLRLPAQKDYLGKLLGGIDEGEDAGCVNNASKDGDTALLPSPTLLVSVRRVLEIAQMLGWADDQEYSHRRSCG